jgi:hypothetical protein
MRRLVLHAGAEFADGGAVQRDLVGWREPLAAAGVMIPPGEDAALWRETAQGLLHRNLTVAANDLVTQAEESGADLLVVSSDSLGDALTSPDQVASLAEMAAAGGFEARVVVVVREQIGYINALYCHRVLMLETARSFAEFATASVPAHRFDYVASFGAIADTDGVDLVAVPYPQLVVKGGGRAVLEAAGVDADALTSLPAAEPVPTSLPGPVLIGAARLLHKRMRRNGMFSEYGKPLLRVALGSLVARATEAGWDDSDYWGWDPGLRQRVEEEYGATDQQFAEFVWGKPWPEPWSTGKLNRADLALIEPKVLEDVFTTVNRVMADLGKKRVPAQPAYDDDHEDVVLLDDDDEP